MGSTPSKKKPSTQKAVPSPSRPRPIEKMEPPPNNLKDSSKKKERMLENPPLPLNPTNKIEICKYSSYINFLSSSLLYFSKLPPFSGCHSLFYSLDSFLLFSSFLPSSFLSLDHFSIVQFLNFLLK